MRDLDRARSSHGDDHPATRAALARAHLAWEGRVPVPESARRSREWRVVMMRGMSAGWDNRHWRRRALRALRALVARPIDSVLDSIMRSAGAGRVA